MSQRRNAHTPEAQSEQTEMSTMEHSNDVAHVLRQEHLI